MALSVPRSVPVTVKAPSPLTGKSAGAYCDNVASSP